MQRYAAIPIDIRVRRYRNSRPHELGSRCRAARCPDVETECHSAGGLVYNADMRDEQVKFVVGSARAIGATRRRARIQNVRRRVSERHGPKSKCAVLNWNLLRKR